MRSEESIRKKIDKLFDKRVEAKNTEEINRLCTYGDALLWVLENDTPKEMTNEEIQEQLLEQVKTIIYNLRHPGAGLRQSIERQFGCKLDHDECVPKESKVQSEALEDE